MDILFLECPKNAHFSECGSDCEPECGLIKNNCLSNGGAKTCVPKCVCNAGYILYDGACISQDYCKLAELVSTCTQQAEFEISSILGGCKKNLMKRENYIPRQTILNTAKS